MHRLEKTQLRLTPANRMQPSGRSSQLNWLSSWPFSMRSDTASLSILANHNALRAVWVEAHDWMDEQIWIAPGLGVADDVVAQLQQLSSNSEVVMVAIFAIFAVVHSGLAFLRPWGKPPSCLVAILLTRTTCSCHLHSALLGGLPMIAATKEAVWCRRRRADRATSIQGHLCGHQLATGGAGGGLLHQPPL